MEIWCGSGCRHLIVIPISSISMSQSVGSCHWGILGFVKMTLSTAKFGSFTKSTTHSATYSLTLFNSLALGRSSCDFKNVIFNLALLIGIFKSYDNIFRWMPQGLTDDKSTLVQVMAWCRQATSHYLNQCWPRSPTPYGITRPQWINISKYFCLLKLQNLAFLSANYIWLTRQLCKNLLVHPSIHPYQFD